MRKGLIWKEMFYGKMKTNVLITVSLFSFIVASWSFFLLTIFVISKDQFKFENSLYDIENKLDYLNDTVDSLSDEKVFEKEMMENLAYYLPEGFSGRVRYTGLTPLDLETGEARVFFTHRRSNYKVDFAYSFNGKKLNIDRESEVTLIQ